MSAFDSPIIILGCRRSGTTLLRAILDGHPQLLVHSREVQFFFEMSRKFGLEVQDVSDAVDYICRHPFCAANVNPEVLDNLAAGRTQLSLRDFSQLYLQAWAGVDEPQQQLVIKHPLLILHLKLVFELFPEARLIHIVRDPRGNIASQRARWPKATLRECINWWRQSLQNGRTQAVGRPETILEVRYEDLVLNPRVIVTQVCELAGVPYTEALLNFRLETISYESGRTPEQKTYTRVDPARLEQWRQYLPNVDIRLIENSCRQEMDWWGYRAEAPAVRRGQLIRRELVDRTLYSVRKTGRAIRSAVRAP